MGKSNLEDWESGHIIVVPRSFAKVSIKGEGDSGGCLDLFTRVTLPHLWIADQVRNDGCHALLHPVDSRLRGNDDEGAQE